MFEYIGIKHSKTGEQKWFIKVLDRLSTDDFKKVLQYLKTNYRAYYFKGGFVIDTKWSESSIEYAIEEITRIVKGVEEKGSESSSSEVPTTKETPKKSETTSKKSIFTPTQINAYISKYEELEEQNRDNYQGNHKLPDGEYIYQKTDNQGIYGLKGNVFDTKYVFYSDVDKKNTLQSGDKFSVGIYTKYDEQGNLYILSNIVSGDPYHLDSFYIKKSGYKITKTGSVSELNLSSYYKDRFFYDIDGEACIYSEKEGKYFPADNKYGYAKSYTNSVQISSALERLKNKGFTTAGDNGRYSSSLYFTPKYDSVIKKVYLAFSEEGLKDISYTDIVSGKSEQKSSSRGDRLDLKNMYENKKRPRRDVLVNELLDGRMEYGIFQTPSPYDGYDRIPLKDVVFTTNDIKSVVSEIRRRGIHNPYIRYEETIGYFVSVDDYYLKYKDTKSKEKNTEIEVDLLYGLTMDELVYSDKFKDLLNDTTIYYNKDIAKLYVTNKQDADILNGLMNELLNAKGNKSSNKPEVSEIEILEAKLSAYRIVYDMTDDIEEKSQFNSLIISIETALEFLK